MFTLFDLSMVLFLLCWFLRFVNIFDYNLYYGVAFVNISIYLSPCGVLPFLSISDYVSLVLNSHSAVCRTVYTIIPGNVFTRGASEINVVQSKKKLSWYCLSIVSVLISAIWSSIW